MGFREKFEGTLETVNVRFQNSVRAGEEEGEEPSVCAPLVASRGGAAHLARTAHSALPLPPAAPPP